VISNEDEQLLWQSGVMSFETPQNLQNMIFYYIGLHFCLRGVQEQHDLKIQQIVRHPLDVDLYDSNTYYEYVELISKNNQHRFKDIHSKNKTTKVFAMVGSTKCVVKMLDFYISKLPENPKSFYLRPLKDRPTDESKPWYANIPVGVNTMKGMLPKMSEEAGTKSRYTNHSLRATSTTRLFNSEVQEKIIQEKSGHRSLAGLRAYEKVTVEQERNVTRILTENTNVDGNKCHDVKDDHKENDDKENDEKDNDDKDKENKAAIFSGQLTNCVFNFYSAK
jgi:hypothetical protein